MSELYAILRQNGYDPEQVLKLENYGEQIKKLQERIAEQAAVISRKASEDERPKLLERIKELELSSLEDFVSFKNLSTVIFNEICSILQNYVGETGLSESPVEVLERKLKEISSLKEQLIEERKEVCDEIDEEIHNKILEVKCGSLTLNELNQIIQKVRLTLIE